jgi:hypothetical protein
MSDVQGAKTAQARVGNNILDASIGLGYKFVHGEQIYERTEELARSNRIFLES